MARLELVDEGAAGARHYLDGQAVHCGDALEVWRDGRWHLVRYERSGGAHDFQAVGYFTHDRAWALRDDDDCRWPGR